MKKVITVLTVLLVATALFAGVTVKAAGTFGFARITSPEDKNVEAFDEEVSMKSNGFGFGAGVQVDVADNLAAYAEFNMIFPKDAEMKSGDSDWVKISDKITKDDKLKLNFFSVSAGVAYKLDFNAVKLAVGAGVTLNHAMSDIKIKYAENIYRGYESHYTNIGLNALVDAKYMVVESVGVGVTLNPQIGLYNMSRLIDTMTDDDPETYKTNGFKVSYAMPITVGVSYTF